MLFAWSLLFYCVISKCFMQKKINPASSLLGQTDTLGLKVILLMLSEFSLLYSQKPLSCWLPRGVSKKGSLCVSLLNDEYLGPDKESDAFRERSD